MELAGHPNDPVRFKDDATVDELRAEIIPDSVVLQEAGVIDFDGAAGAKASNSELIGALFIWLCQLVPRGASRVSVKWCHGRSVPGGRAAQMGGRSGIWT